MQELFGTLAIHKCQLVDAIGYFMIPVVDDDVGRILKQERKNLDMFLTNSCSSEVELENDNWRVRRSLTTMDGRYSEVRHLVNLQTDECLWIG